MAAPIVRKSGPQGAKRPFNPQFGASAAEDRIADALDHIAVALSAIDHNLEVLSGNVGAMLVELQTIALKGP